MALNKKEIDVVRWRFPITMNGTEKHFRETLQLVADKTGVPYEEAVENVNDLLTGYLNTLDAKRKLKGKKVTKKEARVLLKNML